MNLIEQMGGYEATKEKYQALSDSDMITIGPVEFSAKDYFEDELLEYRRQHNIFEYGDRFVIDGLFGVFYANDGNIPYLDYNKIRHATPAEIKAGKRLEAL